jgi:hypothetical protein
MQPTYVMAYRKRLKKRGYSNVSIKRVVRSKDDAYLVTAVEPLSGQRVQQIVDAVIMHNSFRF